MGFFFFTIIKYATSVFFAKLYHNILHVEFLILSRMKVKKKRHYWYWYERTGFCYYFSKYSNSAYGQPNSEEVKSMSVKTQGLIVKCLFFWNLYIRFSLQNVKGGQPGTVLRFPMTKSNELLYLGPHVIVPVAAGWRGWVETLKEFLYSLTAALLRRQKGETASFHTLTSLSAPRTDGQTHISAQTEEGKRGIQSHTTEHPHLPPLTPSPFPNTPPPTHTHSSPTLPLSFSSFSFFHLFKSLHFRCIHTFPISLCMSLSPTLPPPPCLPLSTPSLLLLFSLSLFLSLPPVLTSSYTFLLLSSFLLPYLPPFFPPSIPLL